MTQATASAGLVSSLISFAVAHKAARADLLRAADLSASDLDDPDTRIPLDKYQKLIRSAQSLCGDPAIALKWGESVDIAEFSVVGLIMNASPTMGDALTQLQRYGRLAVELSMTAAEPRLTIQQKGEDVWLVDTRPNPNDFPELSETSFARLVSGPRRFLKQPHVLEIHFTHDAPSHADEYERIFQCPVHFAQNWNAMKLHPDTASWPVQLEPSYVFGILTKHADALLEDIRQSTTTRGQVERLLLPILHTGAFSAESAATELGMSRQSLYRRLKEEQTSFSDVVDGLRNKLAMEYLAGEKTSVNETAYLLGFSDPASFSRAFKRWTGKSPRDFTGGSDRS